MFSGRRTIAGLIGIILSCGIVLAGLRSGSNDWFKLIYTSTFLLLVYAAITARYRDAFRHGFAIAGWAYFLVGFGPWIAATRESPTSHAVNRNIATSVVLEIMSGTISISDSPPPNPPTALTEMMTRLRRANRDGIGHCVLTISFAGMGGIVSRRAARRDLEGLGR
ncbi:hypothetical protein ACYOEI_18345 [Singulisphaera rosea]